MTIANILNQLPEDTLVKFGFPFQVYKDIDQMLFGELLAEQKKGESVGAFFKRVKALLNE